VSHTFLRSFTRLTGSAPEGSSETRPAKIKNPRSKGTAGDLRAFSQSLGSRLVNDDYDACQSSLGQFNHGAGT